MKDKPDEAAQEPKESWRPDYKTVRQKTGFHWRVSGSVSALWALAGVPIREFNLNPQACIEVYRKGRPLFREMFGEEVGLPGVSTPPISYGHVNGLGSELLFPEGGEVAHTHIYDSLEEGIEALQEPVDFESAGMAPFYLDFREKLQAAFPEENVGFSYGAEGPITTAYELRGDGFFMDIFDDPPQVHKFLHLMTRSINEFHGFVCRLRGAPMINQSGSGMCDDLASLIPPHMWEKFVLPFWNQYYRGHTTGRRSAHVENLKPAQLKYLEDIGLVSYDPSISHDLNPEIISAKCRVPFGWRLGSFHYRAMSCQDVKDFVFQAVADGASSVHTIPAEIMVDEATVKKVHAFIEAAKEAERLLGAGAGREEVGERVSASGRKKFWDHWPEP